MINQFRVQNFGFKVFETELVTQSHLFSNSIFFLLFQIKWVIQNIFISSFFIEQVTGSHQLKVLPLRGSQRGLLIPRISPILRCRRNRLLPRYR